MHVIVFQVLVFVAYYLLLTAYWGQARVHSLFLFRYMTSGLSADGAGGFVLSNLRFEVRIYTGTPASPCVLLTAWVGGVKLFQ